MYRKTAICESVAPTATSLRNSHWRRDNVQTVQVTLTLPQEKFPRVVQDWQHISREGLVSPCSGRHRKLLLPLSSPFSASRIPPPNVDELWTRAEASVTRSLYGGAAAHIRENPDSWPQCLHLAPDPRRSWGRPRAAFCGGIRPTAALNGRSRSRGWRGPPGAAPASGTRPASAP